MDKHILDLLDVIGKVVVILGLPLAFIQYRIVKKKERQDREYGTYNALDEKYLEFQKLCLQYPYLDIFDIADKNPELLNSTQKKEELILFTMLISIFERAYLLYKDQHVDLRKKQWVGWDIYIKNYCKRNNFLEAWRISGTTFDTEFESYIESIISSEGTNNTNKVAS